VAHSVELSYLQSVSRIYIKETRLLFSLKNFQVAFEGKVTNFEYGNFDIKKFNFENGNFEFEFNFELDLGGMTADDDRGCYDPA